MSDPKFCGNCGQRKPDGVCRLDQAGFEACAISMERLSWKPMNEPEDRQCIDCASLTPDCTCGLSAAAFETCQGQGLKYFEARETPEDTGGVKPIPEERVKRWLDEHRERVGYVASKWDDEPPLTGISNTQWRIREECQQILDTLLTKNRKYGDSAISPVRVFSKASPVEQINVRLDDKISRIMSGQTDDDEDVELDLIGYLILKRVQRRMSE